MRNMGTCDGITHTHTQGMRLCDRRAACNKCVEQKTTDLEYLKAGGVGASAAGQQGPQSLSWEHGWKCAHVRRANFWKVIQCMCSAVKCIYKLALSRIHIDLQLQTSNTHSQSRFYRFPQVRCTEKFDVPMSFMHL